MDKMAIYNSLPVWGQNLVCWNEGRKNRKTRYSTDFWRALEEYESHNEWSYEQLCEYRDARLRRMVHHCCKTVPYYTKLFREGGIDPDSIRTIDDLKVLPILTKQIVNEDPQSFVSTAFIQDSTVTAHTSGTTGSGFVFKTTQQAICEQWAVWWRYWRRIGVKFNTLCGRFGGRSVVPVTKNCPPFFRWNKPDHTMYFSTYHLSEENLPAYIESLQKYNVTWIHGYPSAVNVLAEYMYAHGIKLPVEYVTTGAENLLPAQQKYIAAAFNTPAYQHYGLSEAVANFSEDKNHTMYVDEDFAATEFMPMTGDGDRCEIIGTNLTNFAMPLLRYRTNDICSVCETSSGRVVTSLDGRLEDYVMLPNGAKIGRLDHIFKDLTGIREAQIIQKDIDHLQVLVAKGNSFNNEEERRLKKELSLRLIGIEIDIIYVDAVPRTASGKLRFVVSEI